MLKKEIELEDIDNVKGALKVIGETLRNKYHIQTLIVSFIIGFSPMYIVAMWWVKGDMRSLSQGNLLYYITPLLSVGITQLNSI